MYDGAHLDSVRRVVAWLGILMHGAQPVLLIAVGLPLWLGAIDLLSIALFVLALRLVRNGRGLAAMAIAFFEIGLHTLLLVVLLGGRTLYWLHFLVLASGTFLAADRSERRHASVGSALAGAGLASAALWRWPAPLDPGDGPALFLAVVNVAAVFVSLKCVVAWFVVQNDRARQETERERRRSEALLLNVLPPAIAARLKDAPDVIADRCSDAAVVFADVVGFTPLASRLPTSRLIEVLNEVFSLFDRLTDRHGLEKIKTIGDAYMAVSGLPEPRPGHVAAAAAMALEMREGVREFAARTGLPLDLRIGLHSGPVVAGVIGRKKFSYDLWGDTVNLASRMESHGQPGRIQVTREVKDAIGDQFHLEPRGPIEVKGKGLVETWFLEPRREE